MNLFLRGFFFFFIPHRCGRTCITRIYFRIVQFSRCTIWKCRVRRGNIFCKKQVRIAHKSQDWKNGEKEIVRTIATVYSRSLRRWSYYHSPYTKNVFSSLPLHYIVVRNVAQVNHSYGRSIKISLLPRVRSTKRLLSGDLKWKISMCLRTVVIFRLL